MKLKRSRVPHNQTLYFLLSRYASVVEHLLEGVELLESV